MKKLNLDPMGLDKETIASLDENQLQEIVGGQGAATAAPGTTSGCGTGTTKCGAQN
jgi:hypothetical protein